jgi:hypothetical protein
MASIGRSFVPLHYSPVPVPARRFLSTVRIGDGNLSIVGDERENKPKKAAARRRIIIEALVLFGFAWLAAVVVFLLRPPPSQLYAGFGPLRFIASTLANGFEIFVFGYLLSRFFKQFKTGCAFVIILSFAYLIWAGRHAH